MLDQVLMAELEGNFILLTIRMNVSFLAMLNDLTVKFMMPWFVTVRKPT